MTELLKAKLGLYLALLNIPPEEDNFTDDDIKLMDLLLHDQEVRDEINKRLDR